MARKPKFELSDTIYLRNMREKGWFWINNELIDIFAPLVGPYAVAVYVCLCRRCEGNSALTQWSQRELVQAWRHETMPAGRTTLSRTSIQRALSQLVAAGLVRVERAATRSQGAIYALPSLPQLAAQLTPEIAEKLAVRIEISHDRSDCEGGPQGATSTMSKTLLKSCGETRLEPILSTEFPGPHVAPTGPYVAPQGAPIYKQYSNTNKTLPPTPLAEGGDVSEPCPSVEKNSDPAEMISIRQCWHLAEAQVKEHLFAPPPRNRNFSLSVDDWDRYFEHIALENSSKPSICVLSSPVPAETEAGFVKYKSTWDRALLRAFGSIPQLTFVNQGEHHAKA